jgi:predicted HAD superfamily Cof-like phosphohydrolase
MPNLPEPTRNIAARIVDEIPDLDLRRSCEKSLGMAPDIVQCVKTFHQVYGMPILRPCEAQDDFSHITKERLAMRFRLIEEEYRELCEAMDLRVDFEYSYMDEEEHWVVADDLEDAILNTENRSLPEVADACEDLKYVITGFEFEMGIDPHAVLAEVQASNLTKMGEDGQPVRREDGKILKGPFYVQANPEAALRMVGMRMGPAPRLSTKPVAA